MGGWRSEAYCEQSPFYLVQADINFEDIYISDYVSFLWTKGIPKILFLTVLSALGLSGCFGGIMHKIHRNSILLSALTHHYFKSS